MIVYVRRKKTIIVTVCVAIAMCYISYQAAAELVRTSGFYETKAVVTKITPDYVDSPDNSHTLCKDVSFDYEVDGTKYSGSYNLLFTFGYAVGEEFTLYYNADDPADIRDDLGFDCFLMVTTGIILLSSIVAALKAGNFS